MARTELTWTNIDIATMDTETRAAYDAYKAQYKVMKDARTHFEALFAAGVIAPGHRVVFGYNFGKLSVALAPDDGKPKAAAKPTTSLADWIATQRDSGRNS